MGATREPVPNPHCRLLIRRRESIGPFHGSLPNKKMWGPTVGPAVGTVHRLERKMGVVRILDPLRPGSGQPQSGQCIVGLGSLLGATHWARTCPYRRSASTANMRVKRSARLNSQCEAPRTETPSRSALKKKKGRYRTPAPNRLAAYGLDQSELTHGLPCDSLFWRVVRCMYPPIHSEQCHPHSFLRTVASLSHSPARPDHQPRFARVFSFARSF